MSTPRNELPVLEGMKGSLVREPPKNREDEIRLSLMGLAALFSYLGFWRSFSSIDFVAIGATLVGGYPVFVETFHSLRHRSINMEVSMTVAIVASLLVGQFTAAVVVTFFVLLSEFIEAYAVDKGRATIVKLEKSIPRSALVRRDGKEIETAVETIQPGETVIVRDGERIPVDGNLVKGSGFVNQSAITGEAVAVEKLVGSRVFAGSVDQSGVFEVRTEKVGNETVFGQIIRLVEEAESRKAPIQRISDKLAAWLVEFTIVFAVITFVVTRNLISTISVIVVAGACGVAAGTPLAIVAVMGGLAKKGVIVKGGVYVQEMSKVDTVVIDKTGTLTLGDPEVTDVVGLDGCSEEQVLTYASAAERFSKHPLAHAIMAKAEALGISSESGVSSDYMAGKGIVSWYDGELVLVGNSVLMNEQHVPLSNDVDATITSNVSEGKTTVLVAHGGRICGVIGISDKVRDESREAVKELGRMGLSTIMLTGDNKVASKSVGEQVGIDEVHAELLPADKVSYIEQLSGSGRRIVMVGDGVNDAPALALANVGIGMGAGTDIAIEEADIVLMTNDLGRIPLIVKASKQAYGVIMQNFYGTLIVDGIGLGLAFEGLLNPLFAAGIHVVSELVFILNSARLIR
ncbi:MAG TPA: cation-translocating P-type ATPase [Candidatus Dormibacteraeota bacterium]|nr:cation-translocating P-type ATPase [Candidatus Dormibacteraeota bacterium]